MAPIKRGAENELGINRTHKKQRISAPTRTIPKAEPSFPRGGASILTPLEQKQIQIEASRDVLFEENTGGKVARPDYDEQANDERPTSKKSHPKGIDKHKANSKRKVVREARLENEKRTKIEGLSYKRLVPGALVLGQVLQVNRHDIALALPNNLTGFVPLSAVSDVVAARLESAAEAENDDDSDSSSEDGTVPDISSFFKVGQYLRAYVVATEDEGKADTKPKRHIALSVNPRQANSGLSPQDLVPNSTVQASVLSIEDYGIRMDLGLDDGNIKGFISLGDLGKEMEKSTIQEGQTFLCMVKGKNAGGSTLKLTIDPTHIGNLKKGAYMRDGPTIDSFLPGTAVEFLVTENDGSGLVGKVMGMLDVTADIFHSAPITELANLVRHHPVGSKAQGRLIATFPGSDTKKIAISLQSHILRMASKSFPPDVQSGQLPQVAGLPNSKILTENKIIHVEPSLGVFLDLGEGNIYGFAHISKLSDDRIDELYEDSGPYKLGSKHVARVLGFNPMDGLYILSLEPRIIKQRYLFFDDVVIGDVVQGKIEKMIVSERGVDGVIVQIAEGVSGLVPESHLTDVRLQHPERKFKEGSQVTARVLSVNSTRRQLRLTLKKSLVNSDQQPWIDYNSLEPGMQSPGTLIKIFDNGALVQFYGKVKGYLPVAEMSESFIQDPREHFRQSQVVNVRVVSVDAANERLLVSCKDPNVFGERQIEALQNLQICSTVKGIVREKSNDSLIIELEGSLKANLPVGHLVDGAPSKAIAAAKRIRIDQSLSNLLVLNKDISRRRIQLSSKPSLLKAAKVNKVPSQFEAINVDAEVTGYVSNITSSGIFVQYAGNLSALLPKKFIPEDKVSLPDFGLWKYKTLNTRVQSLDETEGRFVLTLLEKHQTTNGSSSLPDSNLRVQNPVDETITTSEQFVLGKVTKARIVSVKETQLNMELAEGVQGRIDVSSVFERWQDIQDKKRPLRQFHPKQVLPVRILGMHDSRNHRFLPISHRTKTPVFELSAKLSSDNTYKTDGFALNQVEEGSSWTVFVNKVSENALWVNLSPNVRGRIAASHASDDLNVMTDLVGTFPVGSAIKAKVIKVDVENNHLDLSARKDTPSSSLTLKDLSKGQVLPARVTKITERQIIVHLSDHVSAPLHLVDLTDDFSKASPWNYGKDQVIRVCILDIDLPNKKLILSNRPSRVLSSNSHVEDPDISSASDLKVNDIRRGFVKHVSDNGIFIALSSKVTAFVRVTDLSDLYIKDWKVAFEVDQLVRGKVIAVDSASGHVQMSLKQSHIDKHYKAPLTFNDVYVGQVITGKVRKVEEFGAFIVFDNSANVSGLCHKSQMSDGNRPDPRKLYDEGDEVKAKVLSVDKEKRRISLGVKASLFEANSDVEDEEEDMIANEANDDDNEEMGLKDDDILNGLDDDTDRLELDDAIPLEADGFDPDPDSESDGGVLLDSDQTSFQPLQSSFEGLTTGGFDWTGIDTFSDREDDAAHVDLTSQATSTKKQKRKKSKPFTDHTGDLDAHGPQSTSDFERLLLSDPSSSTLWLSYMAFHIQLSDIDSARSIAQRALRSIPLRAIDQKLNIWIGLLNLENTFGSPETLATTFEEACQYNDVLDITQRLLSIYIQSQKYEAADSLFQRTLFEKKINQSPGLWVNYATFLFQEGKAPERARALLPRAMQALPGHTHVGLTTSFAKLEFETEGGDLERGRTVFEGLVGTWPKRLDLWSVLVEMEVKVVKRAVAAVAKEGGKKANNEEGDGVVKEGKERVRRLFERIVGRKSKLSLRPRKAKFFFKRWVEFEEIYGAKKDVDRVAGLAEQYVKEWEAKKETEDQ